MKDLSVIIPTLNRAYYLRQSLTSIIDQTFPDDRYEIIVVDNGSFDETKKVVEEINIQYGGRVRYVYESCPGLHNARHRGAKEADGEILLYGDDDIIASPEWVEEIWKSFEDPMVGIAGGMVLPEWEEWPPQWVLELWVKDDVGMYMGYLSLLDLGNEKKFVPPGYTYGCNYAIRKKILYDCGGFHPDGMPQKLIYYRGDGETALTVKAMNRGYKIVYNPKACVKHIIPKSRMSEDYFYNRAFNQGISDSFMEMRKECNMFSFSQRISEINTRIDEINTRIDEMRNNLLVMALKNLIWDFIRIPNRLKRYLLKIRLQRKLSSALSRTKNLKVNFLLTYRHLLQDEFYKILLNFLNQNREHKNIGKFIRFCILPFNDIQDYLLKMYFNQIIDILGSGDFSSKREQLVELFKMIDTLIEKNTKDLFITKFTDWVKRNLESDTVILILEDSFFYDYIAEDVNSLKVRRKLILSWRKGKEYHRECVRNDEEILEYVLQKNYFC